MVRALTVRIALSVLLFMLLFVAWRAGLIEPHGIVALGKRCGRTARCSAEAAPRASPRYSQ